MKSPNTGPDVEFIRELEAFVKKLPAPYDEELRAILQRDHDEIYRQNVLEVLNNPQKYPMSVVTAYHMEDLLDDDDDIDAYAGV
jgi:hypothetical protein